MTDFLTVKETAKILKRHPATIRKFIRQRKLPAKKLAGKYGIYILSRSDVLEFMIKKVAEE